MENEKPKRYTILSHKNYYVEHMEIDGKTVYALYEVKYIPEPHFINAYSDFKEIRQIFKEVTGV